MPQSICLTEEQKLVVQTLCDSKENYFITGKAGTGKSVVLRQFIQQTQKRLAVLAPTGIAAINVDGQTIHSFFGLEAAIQNPYDKKSLYKGMSNDRIRLLKAIDTIVIDEISMTRVDVMDMIDAKLKIARSNDEPFGGCQIIVFGDLFQLPPVVGKDKETYEYLQNTYHTIFFFGAPACRQQPFHVLQLTNVFRQKDPKFIETLNQIREGSVTDNELKHINQRVVSELPSDEIITLTSTNSAANKINKQKLASLPLPEIIYQGEIKGVFPDTDYPTDLFLKLRLGAQVMMIKNDQDKRWVNGTIGVISSLTNDLIKVCIAGTEYPVDKETWSKYEYRFDKETHHLEKQETGSFKQYPLRLAYAITIHKSQGQTYDAVVIDYSMSRAFADGQTYVALSRCKNLDKLYLSEPIRSEDIRANQEVIDYMHGTLVLPEPKQLELPPKPEKHMTQFSVNPDGTLSVDEKVTPKKMTGTRFPNILGYNKFNSPFKTWCDLMRVYEEPFQETPFTTAGKIIEPKQFEYAKAVLNKPNREFLTPQSIYGSDPQESTHFDFFPDTPVFGGMWDYLMKEDGQITAVLEMKTKQEKQRAYYAREYPKDLILQGSLYAYLLGVSTVYMVTTFLKPEDYENPQNFKCSKENTWIHNCNIDAFFKGFLEHCILPAQKWWEDYIETGRSPYPSTKEDKELCEKLYNSKDLLKN